MSRMREHPDCSSAVFLAVADGYQARQLLRTGVLRRLQAEADRLVVLVPNPDEQYLRQELAAPNVVLEDLRVDEAAAFMGKRRVQNVLRRVRNRALEIGNARALNDKAWWRMPGQSRRPLVRWAANALVWLCQHSSLVRRGLVAAENRLFTSNLYADLLDRYHPDLVVTGVPGYLPHDTLLLREAKSRRIPTACVICSWDAPHNMGLAGVQPGHVVVWSDAQKREMQRYQGIHPDRAFVGGVPAFDLYRSTKSWPTREEVFAQYGLDPRRKLIVFATKSPSVYLHIRVMEALVAAMEAGRFAQPVQLLMRLHPLHFAAYMAESQALQSIMAEYRALAERTSRLAFSIPQVVSRRLDNDMPGETMVLASLLRHTDVLVNLFSTIQLEACLAGVPVINLAFDPPRGTLPDGFTLLPSQAREGYRLRPIAVDLGQPQGQRVLASGGTRQAHSLEELVQLINGYLENPRLDAEARQRLVAQECGPTDGHAGERIGQFLLGLLKQRPARAEALPR